MNQEFVQTDIDKKNQDFWNELCGTNLAKSLGITGSDPENLSKYDKFYLDFYPYLKKYLYLNEIKNKNVLEIGLGYGTVGQLLAEHGACYFGLDISSNAAAMMNHRLQQNNLIGKSMQGNILQSPFQDSYFDYIFSIGCLHHTGNFKKSIDEIYRILKPGGKVVIMVYNKFSFRQWSKWPKNTMQELLFQLGLKKSKMKISESQRKAYDLSSSGVAAPETDFFSKKDIKTIFSKFRNIDIVRENFDRTKLLSLFGLNSIIVRKLGLDLYIRADK